MESLAIYGDSLLRGVILGEDGAYHSSEFIGFGELSEKYGIDIRNMSMPTFTSVQILAWLNRSFPDSDKPDAVLFECGGNDSDYDWKAVMSNPSGEHHQRTSPDTFETTYRTLIQTVRKAGCEVIVAQLPPFSPKKYFDRLVRSGVDGDVIRRIVDAEGGFGARHADICRRIDGIAAENSCRVLNLGKYFPEDCNALFCEDGMHPNSEGYALINRAFADFLSAEVTEKGTFTE